MALAEQSGRIETGRSGELWRRFRSSSRLAEERLVRRNPHLARALEIEKMEGQRIATWARAGALAVVALLLPFLNPRFEVIYYEGMLAVFLVIGFAQLRAARVGQSWQEMLLILADLALLTLIFIIPNPLSDGPWPTASQYRFGGFPYYFIFLAAATLAYSWRTVQSIGFWAATIWLAGAGAVAMFGVTYPELSTRVEQALDGYDRLFALLDPNSVEFATRVQEVTVLVIVSTILALKSRRARELIVRQADLAAERANLSRYFPQSMVDELAHRNEPMGGVRSQDVAVLFADIVGFSRYAERSSPEDVIRLLRSFHAALEEAVFAHGGTLDKYLGDGIMASFGTPTPSPADAANAIAAAFAMRESVGRLNEARAAEGLEPIDLSVGVHFGPVILGDIGNARRMEFATLGDTVNIASRLEGVTRTMPCRIVVSREVIEAVGDAGLRAGYCARMQLRPAIALKGRDRPIDIWTA